eukprot:693210-Prymnesium_polylepis.1
MAALKRARSAGDAAFVNLFTVGTHSRYGTPSHVHCKERGAEAELKFSSPNRRKGKWRRQHAGAHYEGGGKL